MIFANSRLLLALTIACGVLTGNGLAQVPYSNSFSYQVQCQYLDGGEYVMEAICRDGASIRLAANYARYACTAGLGGTVVSEGQVQYPCMPEAMSSASSSMHSGATCCPPPVQCCPQPVQCCAAPKRQGCLSRLFQRRAGCRSGCR